MSGEALLSKIEKKVIKTIEKSDRPISKRDVAKCIKLSPATTSKYVDVLVAKGFLKIEIYGNIHLVSMGEK